MVLDEIRNLIETEVNEIGIRIDSIEYEKEGSNKFLRMVIDKDGVIDIDDCVAATKIINTILDKNDIIQESYILDISSKERGKQ